MPGKIEFNGTKFGGDPEKLPDFLIEYEMHAAICGWDDISKARFVLYYLTGVARDVYWESYQLQPNEKIEWRDATKFLTEHFQNEIVPGVNFNKFVERQQLDGESFYAYLQEVKRFGRLALDDKLTDEIAMKVFIKGIKDSEVQKFVRLKKPSSTKEALELACLTEYVRGKAGLDDSPAAAQVTRRSDGRAIKVELSEENIKCSAVRSKAKASKRELTKTMCDEVSTSGWKDKERRDDPIRWTENDSTQPMRRSRCRICRRGNHTTNQCRVVYSYCGRCDRKGHSVKDCTKQIEIVDELSTKRTIRCIFCRRNTHTSDQCWSYCVKCQARGHTTKKCPRESSQAIQREKACINMMRTNASESKGKSMEQRYQEPEYQVEHSRIEEVIVTNKVQSNQSTADGRQQRCAKQSSKQEHESRIEMEVPNGVSCDEEKEAESDKSIWDHNGDKSGKTRVTVTLLVNGYKMTALVDTGATISVISYKRSRNFQRIQKRRRLSVEAVNGTVVKLRGNVQCRINYANRTVEKRVPIIKMEEDFIMGLDLIPKLLGDFVLDFAKLQLIPRLHTVEMNEQQFNENQNRRLGVTNQYEVSDVAQILMMQVNRSNKVKTRTKMGRVEEQFYGLIAIIDILSSQSIQMDIRELLGDLNSIKLLIYRSRHIKLEKLLNDQGQRITKQLAESFEVRIHRQDSTTSQLLMHERDLWCDVIARIKETGAYDGGPVYFGRTEIESDSLQRVVTGGLWKNPSMDLYVLKHGESHNERFWKTWKPKRGIDEIIRGFKRDIEPKLKHITSMESLRAELAVNDRNQGRTDNVKTKKTESKKGHERQMNELCKKIQWVAINTPDLTSKIYEIVEDAIQQRGTAVREQQVKLKDKSLVSQINMKGNQYKKSGRCHGGESKALQVVKQPEKIIVCYNCNKNGHIARNCWRKLQKGVPAKPPNSAIKSNPKSNRAESREIINIQVNQCQGKCTLKNIGNQHNHQQPYIKEASKSKQRLFMLKVKRHEEMDENAAKKNLLIEKTQSVENERKFDITKKVENSRISQLQRKVSVSQISPLYPQNTFTETLQHYRNMYGPPEYFIKRRLDFTKMKVKQEILRDANERLKTFVSYPKQLGHLIKPLAKSGFYYTPSPTAMDQVECIYCTGKLSQWKRNDSPSKEHRQNFPTCPFLLKVNVNNQEITDESTKVDTDPEITSKVEYVDYVVVATTEQLLIEDTTIDTESRERTFDEIPELKELLFDDLIIVNEGGLNWIKCLSCKKHTELLKYAEKVPTELFHRQECRSNKARLPVEKNRENRNDYYQCKVEYSLTPAELEARVEYQKQNYSFMQSNDEQRLTKVIEERLKTKGEEFRSRYEMLTKWRKFSEDQETRIGRYPLAMVMDDSSCAVCWNEMIEVIFLPCGHFTACTECSQEMASCPVCRKTIERRVWGASLESYNQGENKISSNPQGLQEAWNGVVDLLQSLTNNVESESKTLKELYEIKRGLEHEHIRKFVEAFGYREDILRIIGIMMSLQPEPNSEELWDELFWKICQRRLEDREFTRELESTIVVLNQINGKIESTTKERIKILRKCKNCMEVDVSVLPLPCGHITRCNRCQQEPLSKSCSECGSRIKEWYVIYI